MSEIIVDEFNPSVTIEGTDKIKDTDNKIRTIMEESKDYVQEQAQSAATQLESKVDTKLNEVTGNPALSYTTDAIDSKLDEKVNLADAESFKSVSFAASSVLMSGDVQISGTGLNITDGLFPVVDGIGDKGYNQRAFKFTGDLPFANCPDGDHYVAMDEAFNPYFFKHRPHIGLYDKTSADDNRLVYQKGQWFNTVGGAIFEDNFEDLTAWTTNFGAGDSASVVNGVAELTRGTNVNLLYKTLTTVVGEEISINGTLIDGTQNARIRVYDAWNGNRIDGELNDSGELLITCPTTTVTLTLDVAGGNGTASFDNISVYKKQATLGTPHIPLSFLPHPYSCANKTPMREMTEVEPLPMVMMDSIEVESYVKAKEFKGKNACTAWVVVNGTTTPPEIEESYNVLDFVRLSPANYRMYFIEDMDNNKYSCAGSAGDDVGNGSNRNVGIFPSSISYVDIEVHNTANNLTEPNSLSIQIFGGKN